MASNDDISADRATQQSINCSDCDEDNGNHNGATINSRTTIKSIKKTRKNQLNTVAAAAAAATATVAQ
jgi:hypothetical protein